MNTGEVIALIKAFGGGGGGSSGGGVLVVHYDRNETLDKTWQEIHDTNFCIIVYEETGYKSISFVVETADPNTSDGEHYMVTCASVAVPIGGDATIIYNRYVTDSADGYPVAE